MSDTKENQVRPESQNSKLNAGEVFQYLLVCPIPELNGYLAIIQSRLQSAGYGPQPAYPFQGGPMVRGGRGRNRGRGGGGRGRGAKKQPPRGGHREIGGSLTQPKEVSNALNAYLAARKAVFESLPEDERKVFKPTSFPNLVELYKVYEDKRSSWLAIQPSNPKASAVESSTDEKKGKIPTMASVIPKGTPEGKGLEEETLGWVSNPVQTPSPPPDKEAKRESLDIHQVEQPLLKGSSSSSSSAASASSSTSTTSPNKVGSRVETGPPASQLSKPGAGGPKGSPDTSPPSSGSKKKSSGGGKTKTPPNTAGPTGLKSPSGKPPN